MRACALRVHGRDYFWGFVSHGVFGAPPAPLVGRGSARAWRFERVRRFRDVVRRLKPPSRLENARFEVGVTRSGRNADSV